MSISFDGVGQVCATFLGGSVAPGKVVKVTEPGTVGDCSDGESFCGVVVHRRDGACAVQVKGFVTVAFSGAAPNLGHAALCGNGEGGVRISGGSDGETWCLVADLDSAAKTVTIML